MIVLFMTGGRIEDERKTIDRFIDLKECLLQPTSLVVVVSTNVNVIG